MNKKKVIVAVSGGFDPVHEGHIRMFQEARRLGDSVVVILNNDSWLKAKKGYVFMNEKARREVIRAIRYVDDVVLTGHVEGTTDFSICRELQMLKPDVFANGGDRKAENIPEYDLCNKLGIEMIFDVGGEKASSSSRLVERAIDARKGMDV